MYSQIAPTSTTSTTIAINPVMAIQSQFKFSAERDEVSDRGKTGEPGGSGGEETAAQSDLDVLSRWLVST